LQETYSAARRKLGVSPELAKRKVSFWDALILPAARSVGAMVLYSEDFQPGAVLGEVRVVNPFAALG
jgi:predicted nucleic acid-binding protein